MRQTYAASESKESSMRGSGSQVEISHVAEGPPSSSTLQPHPPVKNEPESVPYGVNVDAARARDTRKRVDPAASTVTASARV